MLTDQAEPPATADPPADIAATSRCQYRHLRRCQPTADLARIVVDLTSLDPILAAAMTTRPTNFPPYKSGFVGRGDYLAALDRALTASDALSPEGDQPAGKPTVVISAIGGTGGIGKIWLTLTWAYRNLHCFPTDSSLSISAVSASATQADL